MAMSSDKGAERIRTAVSDLSASRRDYGPDWPKKREAILSVRGSNCERCGRTAVQPHLHHLTYERLGNELDEDLMVLCGECHRAVHREERAERAEKELQSVQRAMRLVGIPRSPVAKLRDKAREYDREAQTAEAEAAGLLAAIAVTLYEVANALEDEAA